MILINNRIYLTKDTKECFLYNAKTESFFHLKKYCYSIFNDLLKISPFHNKIPKELSELFYPEDAFYIHKLHSELLFTNLNLHLSNYCNLECKFCYMDCRNIKKKLEVKKELALRIIRQFYEIGGMRLILTGGEPLLYNDISEITSYAKALNLYLILKTNGTLNKIRQIGEHFNEIHISLFGNEKEYYEISGRNLYKNAIDNIEWLVQNKQITQKILLTFTIVPENISLINSINESYPFNLKELEVSLSPPIFAGSFKSFYNYKDIIDINNFLIKNNINVNPKDDSVKFIPEISKYFPSNYCNNRTLTVFPPNILNYCAFMNHLIYSNLANESLKSMLEKYDSYNRNWKIKKIRDFADKDCLANHHFKFNQKLENWKDF